MSTRNPFPQGFGQKVKQSSEMESRINQLTELVQSIGVSMGSLADSIPGVVAAAVKEATPEPVFGTLIESAVVAPVDPAVTPVAAHEVEPTAEPVIEPEAPTGLTLAQMNKKMTELSDQLSAAEKLIQARPKGTPLTAMASHGFSCVKDLQNLAQSHSRLFQLPETNSVVEGYDTESLKQSIANDIGLEDTKRILTEGLKQAGMLTGSDLVQATTSRADIAVTLLPFLAAMTRMTHRAEYIWEQFAEPQMAWGKNIGDTTYIRRWDELPDAPTGEYILDPTVDLLPGTTNVRSTYIKAEILEVGRGKTNNTLAVGIPEFYSATSVDNLLAITNQRLGNNYDSFKDAATKEKFFSTTKVLYNKGSEVVTAPGSVLVNDDGTATLDYLEALFDYLRTEKVPTWANGKYVLALHGRALRQINKELRQYKMITTANSQEELFDILQPNTPNTGGKVSGYLGNLDGFMLFNGNSYGSGPTGSFGVQTETVNGAPTVTRSSLVFGAKPVLSAVAMPFNIRRAAEDNWGRNSKYVWYAHENPAIAADVDVALSVAPESQQTRVYQVRTLDKKI